mgnify:CR=1 FL=1
MQRSSDPGPADTVTFPGCPTPVAPLGVGTWAWGDSRTWGMGSYDTALDETTIGDAWRSSLGAGVGLFDTAVNLRFDQRDSIWLEPDCNAWGWDFAEFRRSGGAGGVYAREPVHNPLPKVLANSLHQLRKDFPDAESLGELLRRFVGEIVKREGAR